MEKYYKQFDGCIQKEVPFCQASCPFHLDVNDFMEKVQRGAFAAAYKTYRNAVTFPAIVADLCHEPCKADCPRSRQEMGGCAIELKALEKTVVREAKNKEPVDYNVPKKGKHIAVIGAGISGLACALRLASKKYNVTVFEAGSGKGGQLLKDYPDKADLYLEDIGLQMVHEDIDFIFNRKIESIGQLKAYGGTDAKASVPSASGADSGKPAFDAVYVATGKGGLSFGLLDKEPNADFIEDLACFAGGSLRQDNYIEALADGIRAASHIEAFLKTGNPLHPQDQRTTKTQLDPSKTSFDLGSKPNEDGSFSNEDAILETNRCFRCGCDSCMIYCDLVAYTNKWPLRIRDEVKATMHKGQADVKPQPAKRLMNFCTHCGLCKEVCPAEIDMDNMFLQAKNELHSDKRMPWGFHDFWQRDMENANSKYSALVKGAPAATVTSAVAEAAPTIPAGSALVNPAPSSYAFFPGCQLGASEPDYVSQTYKLLLECDPSIAMFLKCCGVPVKWAGNMEAHKTTIDELGADWEALGRPTLIAACPSCINNIKEFLPEAPVISLYEYLVENDLVRFAVPADASTVATEPTKPADDSAESSGPADDSAKSIGPVSGLDQTMSIFDPCASSGNNGLREAVRKIAQDRGVKLEPLPVQENNSACCSFGGQVAIAGPKYADFIVERRASESDNPYITYCINCRDSFLGAGKEAVHLLDLILPADETEEQVQAELSQTEKPNQPVKLPTVTERRKNRYKLKKDLLKDVWGEDFMDEMPKADIKLVIGPEMKEKLNKERILEEEIAQVIEFCEATGRKVENLEKGSFSGYKLIGNNTYWAEYKKEGDEYHLLNAYFHRMKIDLEAVWNGKRVQTEK